MTSKIPQDYLDDFSDLCALARLIVPPADRPWLWAHTQMQRRWATAVARRDVLPVPLASATEQMCMAWELSGEDADDQPYTLRVQQSHPDLDEWVDVEFDGVLELVCRWALDSIPPKSQLGAAVMTVGNLAIRAAARRVPYCAKARAVLPALQAGYSVAAPVGRMLANLTPGDSLAPLVESGKTFDDEIRTGDLLHLGIVGPSGKGVELVPVTVTMYDPAVDGGVARCATDTFSPAASGLRIGTELAFDRRHVLALITRPTEMKH